MPQRFLKPGITTSLKWNACTWMAQSFYIRLLTLVDDYGRYEAHPRLLRSLAFPLSEDLRTEQVLALMKELQAQQLAHFYKAGEKEYLQLTGWSERARAETSRYPEYDNTCEQMFSDVVKSCGILPPSPSPSPPSSPSGSAHAREPAAPHRNGKVNGGENGYPQPKFEQLPTPLFAGTASQMLKACDGQIEIVKRIAKEKRVAIVQKTAEGTQVRTGWKYPEEAQAALDAWDKRKQQISQALAG